MDPTNLGHIRRLRNSPEFLKALPTLKPYFEELQRCGLRPAIDGNGEFQITSEPGGCSTQDVADRARQHALLVGKLLRMKNDPASNLMLVDATKLFRRGEL